MATVGDVINLASESNAAKNNASSQSNQWSYLDKYFELKLKKTFIKICVQTLSTQAH